MSSWSRPLTAEDGTPRECALNLDHVQTVSRAKLGGVHRRLDMTRIRLTTPSRQIQSGFK